MASVDSDALTIASPRRGCHIWLGQVFGEWFLQGRLWAPMGANGRQWASMGLGWCLLNTKVFTPDLDNMEKVDLSKGFGNSRKKL